MAKVNRRNFIALLTAAGVSTSLTAKPVNPVNKLIPFMMEPEQIRPGIWTYFATTCRECPAGCGMYVRHRDGRVVKAEGNPTHPINHGGLCPRGQSAPQGLYDPDRIKSPFLKNKDGTLKAVPWGAAISQVKNLIKESGNNVAVISDLQTGTLFNAIQLFLHSYGSDRHLIYEPFNYEPIRKAHHTLFGIDTIPQYRVDKADLLISFGADFLETWISPVEFSQQFAQFRSLNKASPSKYFYIGPRLSMSAANADYFLMVPPGEERWAALEVLKAINSKGILKNNSAAIQSAVNQLTGTRKQETKILSDDQINLLVKAFSSAKAPLLLYSPVAARNSTAATELSVICSLINFAMDQIGTTVDFSRTHAFTRTASEKDTQSFLSSISNKDTLIILNSNIAFTRPDSRSYLQKANQIIYLGTLPDETAQEASWLLPIDSPMESWGDYEPYTGMLSTLQPTMSPLFDTKNPIELFLSLADESTPNFQKFLYDYWNRFYDGNSTSNDTLLRTGYRITNKTLSTVQLYLSGVKPLSPKPNYANTLPIWVWPSIMLYDGRLANRGWLQESPEPISYASWSAWIDIHPSTAKQYHIHENTVIKITNENGTIELPTRVSEQMAPNSLGIILGQGHHSPGLSTAQHIGSNSFEILSNKENFLFGTAQISKRNHEQSIVYTSPTYNQHKRDILRTVKWDTLQRNTFQKEEIIYPLVIGYSKESDLYPPHQHWRHRWAMVVDLDRCIGCGACGVACYAENNIVVNGKEAVDRGREMAWLKIVPYQTGSSNTIAWLPMLCQHCDAAPCEPVCPVYASVHNNEGLNAQIYNRCVGTRYCNNNCPYKVRRFNWYNTEFKQPLDKQLNPEVTVRCRGVMEKCTFCVQRIREAEYTAMREHREVRDQEIQPACVQSCPTRVYTFGDLLNKNSNVRKLIFSNPRRYQVLKELNTKPAVIYLKKVTREI